MLVLKSLTAKKFDTLVGPSCAPDMNMTSFRKHEYGRFSMNLAVGAMEQERLQGWLSVASVESGKKRRCTLAIPMFLLTCCPVVSSLYSKFSLWVRTS